MSADNTREHILLLGEVIGLMWNAVKLEDRQHWTLIQFAIKRNLSYDDPVIKNIKDVFASFDEKVANYEGVYVNELVAKLDTVLHDASQDELNALAIGYISSVDWTK